MKKRIDYFHHEDHHHGDHHHGDHHHHGEHGHGEHHHGEGNRHHGNGGGGFGPSGTCTCMKCGYSAPHQRGMKCTKLKCPECGHVLARKELVDQRKKDKK